MQTYIRHFFWVLRRYFLLIIVGVILCTSLTAVVGAIKPPKYEAIATIQVAVSHEGSSNDIFSNQASAVGYALKVTNDEVLKAAVQKLHNVSLEDLKKSISAAPVDNTQLIDVRADTSDAQLSADEANAVANAFINNEIAKETQRLQSILDKIGPQLAVLGKTVDTANAASLQSTYNNAQSQLAMLPGSLTLDQRATAPTTPTGTSFVTTIGLAVVASVVLMFALALLLDWIDISIRTPEDVMHLAQLEPLGSIPLRKNGSTRNLASVASDEALEQAFTVIGTNFQALYGGQRSILVTGLGSQSGISTIASQLAISLAQSGLRVLLIDGNLRKPALQQVFSASNARGLSDVLSDVYQLKKQRSQLTSWLNQWQTSIPNLWLLPAGLTSVSPLTVLRSAELRKLIDWLVQEKVGPGDSYPVDLVIFDAPAIKEQADVSALGVLCDGSLLVVEAAKERKETLRNAQTLLQRLATPLLGVVVNKQKAHHYPYFYVGQSLQPSQSVSPLPISKYTPLYSSEELPAPPKATSDAPTMMIPVVPGTPSVSPTPEPASVKKYVEAKKVPSSPTYEQGRDQEPNGEVKVNQGVDSPRATGLKAPSFKKLSNDDWERSRQSTPTPDSNYSQKQQNRN